jgi:cell division protein FtsW
MAHALAAPAAKALDRGARRRDRAAEALITATLCLLAVGAVMVYSASAPTLLSGGGSGMSELISFAVWAAVGLGAAWLISRRGVGALRALTAPLLALAFVLLIAVHLPHLGHATNGAQRWIGIGPFEFEPSELMKLALVLYTAQVLAGRLGNPPALHVALKRIAVIGGAAALLVVSQPDLGTTLVITFTLGAMIVVAGVRLRMILYGLLIAAVLVLGFALVNRYAFDRLTSFVNPWAHSGTTGYQAVQGQVAIGSGGLFGRGPGGGITKDYLPNGSTDFILAVIGEELGVIGVCAVLLLYGIVIFCGLRIARAAHDSYSLALAAGVTALIGVQAVLNVFAVLSLAPLTGVPLPFVSYGSSSLLVMLAALGALLAVARDNAVGLRLVERTRGQNPRGSDRERSPNSDRGRWDGGARHAGAGRGRRASHARG